METKKALWNFEGHGFQGQGDRQHFQRRHTDGWFAIEDHLVILGHTTAVFYYCSVTVSLCELSFGDFSCMI